MTHNCEGAGTLGYIRSKASMFVRIGPDAYRRQDFFSLPDITLTSAELAGVIAGMQQIAEGRGCCPDRPITGLGVSVLHALFRTLHFCFGESTCTKLEQKVIADRITWKHVVTGAEIVVHAVISYDDDELQALSS